MNTSPRFRYYLAFVLLALLGLAVRGQNVAEAEDATLANHTLAAAPLSHSLATAWGLK